MANVSAKHKTPVTTPWAKWRALALVTLGWPPSEFWAATPHDLVAALDATFGNGAHGLTPDVLQQLDNLRNTSHEL